MYSSEHPADSLSLFSRFRLYRTSLFFFFNDTATTEIYTLSLHDALPLTHQRRKSTRRRRGRRRMVEEKRRETHRFPAQLGSHGRLGRRPVVALVREGRAHVARPEGARTSHPARIHRTASSILPLLSLPR